MSNKNCHPRLSGAQRREGKGTQVETMAQLPQYAAWDNCISRGDAETRSDLSCAAPLRILALNRSAFIRYNLSAPPRLRVEMNDKAERDAGVTTWVPFPSLCSAGDDKWVRP
jgi:hypothetical protein